MAPRMDAIQIPAEMPCQAEKGALRQPRVCGAKCLWKGSWGHTARRKSSWASSLRPEEASSRPNVHRDDSGRAGNRVGGGPGLTAGCVCALLLCDEADRSVLQSELWHLHEKRIPTHLDLVMHMRTLVSDRQKEPRDRCFSRFVYFFINFFNRGQLKQNRKEKTILH